MSSPSVQPPEPQPLEYASAKYLTPNHLLYRFALGCGLLPLIVGVLSLLLYIPTRADFFKLLGFSTLMIGPLLFLGGIVNVSVYRFQATRARPADAKLVRRRFWIALLILLINFPAAAICFHFGSDLASENRSMQITIVNAGSTPIDQLTLSLHSGPVAVGPIAPGGREFRDGLGIDRRSLQYRLLQNRNERTGVIATPGPHADELEITVNDGVVTARPIQW